MGDGKRHIRFRPPVEPPTRVASVAVTNSRGEILMGRRNDSGRWTLPGGHMEAGEAPEQAAERELFEEAGIDMPGRLEYLGEDSIVSELGHPITVHSYRARTDAVSTPNGDPDGEVAEWHWISTANGLPEEVLLNLHARRNTTLQRLGLQPVTDQEALERSEPMSKRISPDLAGKIRAWTDNKYYPREKIHEEMMRPEYAADRKAMTEGLRRETRTRIMNGERHYLLHRGTNTNDPTHREGRSHVTYHKPISFTPDRRMAASMAEDTPDYHREKGLEPGKPSDVAQHYQKGWLAMGRTGDVNVEGHPDVLLNRSHPAVQHAAQRFRDLHPSIQTVTVLDSENGDEWQVPRKYAEKGLFKPLTTTQMFRSEGLKKEIWDMMDASPEEKESAQRFHGWINPEGKFHQMSPTDVHDDVAYSHLDERYPDLDSEEMGDAVHIGAANVLHKLGWISVGQTGRYNAAGYGKYLHDPGHPATKTLAQMSRGVHQNRPHLEVINTDPETPADQSYYDVPRKLASAGNLRPPRATQMFRSEGKEPVDHFAEWLRWSNKSLRAFPSSPKQKQLRERANAHLAESMKNPEEHQRRLDTLTGKRTAKSLAGDTYPEPRDIVVTIPKSRQIEVKAEEADVARRLAAGEEGIEYYWQMGRLPKVTPRRIYFCWDGAVRAWHAVTGVKDGRIYMDPEIHELEEPTEMAPFMGYRYFNGGPEFLDKGAKEWLAGTLAAASLMSPAQVAGPRHDAAPQRVQQVAHIPARETPPEPHPMDGFLDAISQVETSGGKNLDHKRERRGLHAGYTAQGEHGLMPIVARETAARSSRPELQRLGRLHPRKVQRLMAEDPDTTRELAREHASYLHGKFGGDPEMMAYAWRRGPYGGHTPEQAKADPYVRAFAEHFQKASLEKGVVHRKAPGFDPSHPATRRARELAGQHFGDETLLSFSDESDRFNPLPKDTEPGVRTVNTRIWSKGGSARQSPLALFRGEPQPGAAAPFVMEVYRGTSKTGKPNDYGVAGKGEYHTPHEHVALQYADGDPSRVARSKVTLRNPLVTTYGDLRALQTKMYGKSLTGFEPDLSEKFDRWMRDQGYDGAVIHDPEEHPTLPAEVVKLGETTDDMRRPAYADVDKGEPRPEGHHAVPLLENPRGRPASMDDKVRRVNYHLSNMYDHSQVRDVPPDEHRALHSRKAEPDATRTDCAWCGRTRGGDGTWAPAPEPERPVSHGICPDCEGEHFPEPDMEKTSDSMDLEHYSDKRLDTIDPSHHGEGVPGHESARKRNPDWVDRSYYYDAGTRPEDALASKRYRHRVSVPGHKIYDLHTDPHGFRANALDSAGWPSDNVVESRVRAAGYSGFRHSGSDMPNVVALFHPQRVGSVEEKAELRPFVKRDLDPAEGIEISHRPDTGDNDFMVVEARRNGRVVGHAQMHAPREDGTLLNPLNVEVDPEHRRKGVATAMYRHAEAATGRTVLPAVHQIELGQKLSSQTKVRRAKDGKREFLLHRGMSSGEYDKSGGGTTHPTHTSWTPKLGIAHSRAEDPSHPEPGRVASAWVHERNIHHVPNQLGDVGTGPLGGKPFRGKNDFRAEYEVIVGPNHNSTPASRGDIDTETDSRAGETENNKAEGVEKSNYGPRGYGLYDAAANQKRKQANSSDIEAGWQKVKVKSGANRSGGQGKPQTERQAKEYAKLSRKNPIRRFTADEIRALQDQYQQKKAEDDHGYGDAFSIVSGQQPRFEVSETRPIQDVLVEHGYRPVRARGVYGGKPEESWVVPGADPAHVEDIANRYGQESVVHHSAGKNRLVFTAGPQRGHEHRGEGIQFHPEAPADNYTTAGGKHFTLGLDFSKVHRPFKKRDLDPKEGITIRHRDRGSLAKPTSRTKVTALEAIDRNGKRIGHAEILHRDKAGFSAETFVEPEHRRKGIASAMYRHFETETGKKLVPALYRTPSGKALWDQPKREFGRGNADKRVEDDPVKKTSIDKWGWFEDAPRSKTYKYLAEMMEEINSRDDTRQPAAETQHPEIEEEEWFEAARFLARRPSRLPDEHERAALASASGNYAVAALVAYGLPCTDDALQALAATAEAAKAKKK